MDDYVQAAMRRAVYEVDSDGSAYGSIAVTPELIVSASAGSQHQCIRVLRRNVEHAVETALNASVSLPPIDGIAPPSRARIAA